MDNLVDIVGSLFAMSALAAPFIIMPLIWKYAGGGKMVRIMAGLLLSATVSYILFCISLAITLRNGLGPG
jgi:hypothetical protein